MGENSFRYLDVRDVMQIHDNTIRHDGGSAGLRDLGLLESALTMPRQQFGGQDLHPSLAAKAAAYLFHLAQNHAFVDGNKRVAVIAAYVFLDQNNVELKCPPDELEKITLDVASGEMSKQALTKWFEKELGNG